MDTEWDPRKAADNLRKHGVDFADAVIALEDENALTIEDRGHDIDILYVIHTYRDHDCIRIISARKADRSEARQYYRGLKL